MTDRDNALMQMGNDLELITSYLNGHLDPERAEQVRRRLDEDPEFRDLAEPMRLTWSVPTHLARHPRPAGELEKHWDDFTKRAGFIHQKRRRARGRWLTILSIAAIVLTSTVFAIKDRVRAWYVDRRDFHSVAYAPGWIPIGEGREVQLVQGSRLRVGNKESDGTINVRLAGTARFRIFAVDSVAFVPELHFIAVSTQSALTVAGSGEFTVREFSDTTEVEVHHPAKRQYIGFLPLPSTVYVSAVDQHNQFNVVEGKRARVVRGAKPQLIP